RLENFAAPVAERSSALQGRAAFPRRESLHAFDKVELRKDAVVVVGVGLAVGCDRGWRYETDSGSVGGSELLPEGFLSGRHIEQLALRGKLTSLIDVDGVAIGGPLAGRVVRLDAGNGSGLAALQRIDVGPAVRSDRPRSSPVRRDASSVRAITL